MSPILRKCFPALITIAIAAPWFDTVCAEGDNAIPSSLAQDRLLLDASAAGELIVTVGQRGHILWSRDRGNTWTQAAVPTRTILTGVFLYDDHLGWAVGHNGVILRTRDGGVTWTVLHVQGEEDRPLLDVLFLDAQRGFAIGAYGLFLATTDGGDSWHQGAVSDDDWHLNQIARTQDGLLYIAAEAGNIYRSDDDGDTWVSLSSPYTGSFFGILPLKKDTLLVFGLRGHLYRSEDAGATWQPVESGTDALLSGGLVARNGTVVLVGHDGTLLESRDNGLRFQRHQDADRTAFSNAVQASDGTLVLVGEAGVCRKQINEGEVLP
jgi:photosystem II stability/assembly factor-like uncharacterized protein